MQTVRLIERSAALPIGERVVFRELYLEGRTPEEICDAHGWTMSEFQATNASMLRGIRCPLRVDVAGKSAAANDDVHGGDHGAR
jgi:hypothetical protein